MKKILSLGAAAAVLSLTAAVASAAVAPAFSTDAPVAGETVTVEITANGMTQPATTFTVKASDNLELVDSKTYSDSAVFNTDTMIYAWAGINAPADGTALLTLTYTVNAAADEEISVSLVPAENMLDIDAAAVTATVVAKTDDVVDPTVDTVDTVDTADTTDTIDGGLTDDTADTADTADTSDAGKDDNKGDNKGNPDTGVALAVVPAVLAGAAIVVAKKRK